MTSTIVISKDESDVFQLQQLNASSQRGGAAKFRFYCKQRVNQHPVLLISRLLTNSSALPYPIHSDCDWFHVDCFIFLLFFCFYLFPTIQFATSYSYSVPINFNREERHALQRQTSSLAVNMMSTEKYNKLLVFYLFFLVIVLRDETSCVLLFFFINFILYYQK